MTTRTRSALVALLAIATLAYLGRGAFGELHRLREASLAGIGGIALLYVAARAASGEVMRLALRRLGHRVGRGEAFVLSILTSYTNLVLPRGGMGTPALYLKLRHGVTFSAFGSLLLPMAVLHAVSVGLLGLACMALAWAWLGVAPSPALGALFALAAAGGAAASAWGVPAPASWTGRLGRGLRRLREGWTRLGGSLRFLALILGLQLLMALLRGARLGLAFWAVGAGVGPLEVLIVSLVSDLSTLVSVTPAGLGIREAAIAYGSTLVGVGPAVALSAAILDRLVFTLVIVLLGQLALWREARRRRSLGSGIGEAPPLGDDRR